MASAFAQEPLSDADGGYLSDVIPSHNSNISSDQDLVTATKTLDSRFPATSTRQKASNSRLTPRPASMEDATAEGVDLLSKLNVSFQPSVKSTNTAATNKQSTYQMKNEG